MEIDWRIIVAIAVFGPLVLLWFNHSKRNKFDGSRAVLLKLFAAFAILGVVIAAAIGVAIGMGWSTAEDALLYGFVAFMCWLLALIAFGHYRRAGR